MLSFLEACSLGQSPGSSSRDIQNDLMQVSLSSAGMKAPNQVENGYFRLSTSTWTSDW